MIALLMLAVAAATILGALGFEHIGGYEPCPLCLMQRTPYYIGIPIVAAALVAAWLQAPRSALVVLFAAFGLLMLYNAGLATYHAGVEWGFWEGPAACAEAPGGGSAADMLSELGTVTPASCTQAVWRLLGLSFAGWNVLISALLAALGLYAARTAWRRA
jgi:disulfide bond formation protein DsbB